MPTLPYRPSQADCAAALQCYAQVFGGTDPLMMRHGQGPVAPPDRQGSDGAMLGQVTLGDGTLIACGDPPDVAGSRQQGFAVIQTTPNADCAQAVFDLRAEGGQVIDPFHLTVYSPGSGMVCDRVGIGWIISGLQPLKETE